MQADSEQPFTNEYCPQCRENNSAYWVAEKPPPFCMSCHFPLLLVAGKYRLVRMISEGGCGIVYEAHHTELTRDPKRAVKVIKPELMSKPGILSRFSREVQITGALSQQNQHIVRIYDDFGKESGLGHFYVMEYLEGLPLDALLEKADGALSVELVSHIFLQLCDAMKDAHAEGVIHRDLKPENLFIVSKRRDAHFLKVVDFGIAKPVNSGASANKLTAGVLGTPSYMSPEQCTNGQIDARTDIYAMGCILFELLTGFAPFSAETLQGKEPNLITLLRCHMTQPPPDLNAFLPSGSNFSPTMAEVINRAMAKAPDERFPSIEAFEAAFREAKDWDVPTTMERSPLLGDSSSEKYGTLGYESSTEVFSSDQAKASDIRDFSTDETIQKPDSLGPMQETKLESSESPSLSYQGTDTYQESLASGGRRKGIFAFIGTLVLLGVIGLAFQFKTSPRKAAKRSVVALTPQVHAPKTVRVTPQLTPKQDDLKANKKEPNPKVTKQHNIYPKVHPKVRPHERKKIRHLGTQKRILTKKMVLLPRKKPIVPSIKSTPRGRVVVGCPNISSLYWIQLLISEQTRRKVRVDWLRGSGKIQQGRGYICVGAKQKGAVVRLFQRGDFHPCSFRVWKRRKKSIRIQMVSEDEPHPSPTQSSRYCIN